MGQAVIVSKGAVPSDEGHSRANCEAVHKLASSIGDPFGEARGSGVVFGPQVEAPADQLMWANPQRKKSKQLSRKRFPSSLKISGASIIASPGPKFL